MDRGYGLDFLRTLLGLGGGMQADGRDKTERTIPAAGWEPENRACPSPCVSQEVREFTNLFISSSPFALARDGLW